MARGDRAVDVTIADLASLSGEVDLEGAVLVGIAMPAAWTAANLTFQAASATGGTFQDVYDDAGGEVTVIAAVSRAIGVDVAAGALAPFRYIKVRSGTTGTPVVQTPGEGLVRTITLVLKG